MVGIKLNIRGWEFSHPAENAITNKAFGAAEREKTSRMKASFYMLFATATDLGNSIIYIALTVLGTVKKFPTEGKVEAKKYLIDEGTKAGNTIVYTAASALLTIAALFKPAWALSHFTIDNCPSPPTQQPTPPQQGQRAATLAQNLVRQDGQFQIDFCCIGQVLEGYSQDAYYVMFAQRYNLDESEVDPIIYYSTMKLVLAAVIFMKNDTDSISRQNKTLIQAELVKVRVELADEKRKEQEENQRLRAEQQAEYAESLRRDQEGAAQAQEMQTPPKDRQTIEKELKSALNEMNERLKEFGTIKDPLKNIYESMKRLNINANTLNRFMMRTQMKKPAIEGAQVKTTLPEKSPLLDYDINSQFPRSRSLPKLQNELKFATNELDHTIRGYQILKLYNAKEAGWEQKVLDIVQEDL